MSRTSLARMYSVRSFLSLVRRLRMLWEKRGNQLQSHVTEMVECSERNVLQKSEQNPSTPRGRIEGGS